MRKILYLVAAIVCAGVLLGAKAKACDFEYVCVSAGHFENVYVPPVYGYLACGRSVVISGGYYTSYWVEPRYEYRPVPVVVYAPQPVYYQPVYYQPAYRPAYGARSCGWRSWLRW